MDGWEYVSESGRKESGFENLKTRFQDCNLSRKQESKPDGMIKRKQSFNRESKQAAKKASCLCGMDENKEARKKTGSLCRKVARNKEGKKKRSHSLFRSFNMERKKTIRQSVRMENNKEVSL